MSSILEPMLRKLELRNVLDASDRAAILALPYQLRSGERGTCLVREGDRPERACLLLTGFACRHKVTSAGGRQIVSIHIPGDFVDLQSAFLDIADHNVEALGRCEFAMVAHADVRALACARPPVALAMWMDTLIEAAIYREWIINNGRRGALARVAHLICELGSRLHAVGLASADRFEIPLNQDQMADATGLTPVHVNRTLRELDRTGLIDRVARTVHVKDWAGLREIADFNETYLHFDQLAAKRETQCAPAPSARRDPPAESLMPVAAG